MVEKRKHAKEVEKVKKKRNHLTTEVEKIYSPQQKATNHNKKKTLRKSTSVAKNSLKDQKYTFVTLKKFHFTTRSPLPF